MWKTPALLPVTYFIGLWSSDRYYPQSMDGMGISVFWFIWCYNILKHKALVVLSVYVYPVTIARWCRIIVTFSIFISTNGRWDLSKKLWLLWYVFICCQDCPLLLLLYKSENVFQQSFVFVSTLLALNLNWAIATWWKTHSNLWDILVCFRLQSPIHWLQSPKAHKELCPKTGILLKVNIRLLLAGGRPEAPLAKVEAVHLKSPRMIRGGTILGRSIVCTGLNLTLPQASAYGHKEKHGLNHSNECKAFLNAEYLFVQLQPRKISELCNCKPMVHNWVNFILFYKNKTVLPCFHISGNERK